MELREQIARALEARVSGGDAPWRYWLEEADAVLEVVRPIIEERDALRAEIEGMWKQEPALYVQGNHFVQSRYSPYLGRICQQPMQGIHSVALYLAPGAQPAEVPEKMAVRTK